ncbi:hypothetical protein B9Z51_01760 [Limnohabitans sp. T6-5]|uniref:hypothetical protein n=1 Tax=Limnohabitans sp. T6-5 TaxID=1100724 RepID=UPI000DD27C68|nr:hypothetical protein [Limnohabitans sp. T6-5]PUE11078.1 hypothetical protein B9Z51_01760 [Limnohabitans sp. T6-5]
MTLAWASNPEPTAPLQLLPSPSASGVSSADAGTKFSKNVQAASQATQELQNGFSKLQRLCTYGNDIPASSSSQVMDVLAPLTAKAQSDLANVQAGLQSTAKTFSQSSRITKNSYCRYVPPFGPLAFVCEGFRYDSAKLHLASRDMQIITADAHQRLYLYEQFVKLEEQGCTRAGFTMKLWETETTFLWPVVLQAPVVFKTTLTYAPSH